MFRKRLSQQKKRGSRQSGASGGQRHKPDSVRPRTPVSASHDEDSEDMDFPAPRKSRLSAPQLQAQLSRLTGRTRLRRLKNTLLSEGAWQQVTRIEDLCHTHVSHEWLYHLDACAGSVLTPHDYITNAQKRLGNRAWTGFGDCPLCACVHAVLCGLKLTDPRPTTDPRGLTATQPRPADIFTAVAVPGRSAALDVCVASFAAFGRRICVTSAVTIVPLSG